MTTARPQTQPFASSVISPSSGERSSSVGEESGGYDTLGADEDEATIPGGTLVAGGRLRVLDWIARGAMATVYEAVEIETDAVVALKVLGGKYADLPDAEPRLFAEATYAAKLGNHPHVVRPLYWGKLDEWNGRAYLVSELVDGPTLKDYLLSHDVSTATTCELLRDLAGVLAEVHDLDILHRDVKPSNVLIATPDAVPVPKLTDFGLATTLDATEPPRPNARLTQEYERLGTKHYMAPEQCLGLQLTPACDVYALGVTAYECFVGAAPWGTRTEVEVVQRKCDATQPGFSLGAMRLGLPEALCTVVDAALSFEPSRRPTMKRMREVFASVASSLRRGDVGFVDVPTRELSRRASERIVAQEQVITTDAQPMVCAADQASLTGQTTRVLGADRTSVVVAARANTPDAIAEHLVLEDVARRVRWPVLLAVAVLVGAVGIAIAAVQNDTEIAEAPAASPPVVQGPPDPSTSASADDGAPSVRLTEVRADPASAAVAAPKANASRGAPAIDPPSKAARPSERVKPSAPVVRPPPPSAHECQTLRERAERAVRSHEWSVVLDLTSSAACWKDRSGRLRLVVRALSGLGDYEGCVRQGGGSNDPMVASTVEFCREKRESP